MKKQTIYQVFTRLFGNTNRTNISWGTIEQNGVGKFSDFTDRALVEIKKLGITYIWYTGVPHHAVIGDYKEIGINNDHPSVVKGRAGSPYAVKDYYSVNPDLADNPSERNQEFEALIARTHNAGMKVIIDIVPNHVARVYKGLNNPKGVSDFGANDDTSLAYAKDNNFYYIPNQAFELPDTLLEEPPLGGEKHLDLIALYKEFPAKWTGNGSRLAKPNHDDWYETVKVNYGVKPDGSMDFATLPEEYRFKSANEHLEFWSDKELPDSWVKFRDIALYWLEQGVDGFRYDMAEMVPVEFWSFMNSSIKHVNPDAFLMAEVYQPDLYRDYIQLGKMDYLYDKVDLYDALKEVIQDKGSTREIGRIQHELRDIEHHMLHFLDNHDEQRVASPEFAGSGEKGKPAMLVSACLSTSPTMIYFGQEVGEAGAEMAGFGQPSRTSIFDYIGVPAHQRWMNEGRFDGGLLSPAELELRNFYSTLLNLTLNHSALCGEYHDLYAANFDNFADMQDKLYAFARSNDEQAIIIATNFSDKQSKLIELIIPDNLVQLWKLGNGQHPLVDKLNHQTYRLKVDENGARIELDLAPLATHFLCLDNLNQLRG
ncbi:alpha-amylase family protein [Vibrio europaeus]|uniref:Alpha-amylase n=1 Tax=Vibrio europaeus TaxID=300876 RepID=A0AAE7AYV9_9VIBR|nr:alpha-amylase family protein [Vibrio europaeus]MDC5805012.1 alpha-amylase family protein [Vibrio europaeus]MDC5811683.1 alpha-amylase family protein [Vibrio europaeus]MDC5826913.1 alpha-amylase family protein [Vibrio europaeus]MDC5832279.1 alpha-amylase family protein [Vibrio europaeus]MDC5835234.1 alpha-amylase family protein [Vibrio europaeus]